MQNDRLHLVVILAEKKCKIMLCRKRYLQNKWRKMVKEVQISLTTVHYLAIFFQQEWPWDWAGHFAYHKPCEFNRMGDDFFMDFSFFTHGWGDKDNFTIFFYWNPFAKFSMSSLLGQVHWEGFVVCLVLFARKGLPGVVCLVVFATSGPNFCLGWVVFAW